MQKLFKQKRRKNYRTKGHRQMQQKERTLPEDLLQEILVKVSSVESLIRLSCVCKAWHDLITNNPYFGEAYFKSCINNETRAYYVTEKCLSGNLKKYEVKAENLSKGINSPDHPLLPFVSQPLQLPYYTSLLGSCNGILCLLRENVIHLYNPSILEHHILPTGLLEDDENYINEHVGFGFDHPVNEFKVVRFCFDRRAWSRALKQAKYVEIYRHSMNCWTLLENDNLPLNDHEIYGCGGVFVNGSFHWLVKGMESNLPMKILTFDFGAEKFGEVECIDSIGFYGCLSVLENSLALICSKLEIIDLWVMKDSWTKKLSIEIPGGLSIPLSFINCWVHDVNRLELLEDDGLLTCLLDEEEGKKFKVVTRTRILHDSQVVSGIAFRPTLLSLRGTGRVIARNSKIKRKKT